jgi:NodT family efflux transporter outer membrane factor (OMF) lipoprotein
VVTYQVDIFGQIRRTIEAASASADAALAAEDAARVTVAGETASAYANLCGYGRQIAVAKASLAVVQQTYDLTRQQRDAGALSDFDVEREAVLLEQSRASIPPLEGQRRAALFTLAALIGATPGEVPAAAVGCAAPPTLSQPLPTGDGAALLRRRPDLRQAERQLAAATAKIGVATAQLYPTVTLGAGGSAASGSLTGLVNNPATTFGLGSNSSSIPSLISWTFPNVLTASAHIKEARAQTSGALASFDSAVLTALKEAETALAAYAAELDHHGALVTARTHADAALRLAQVQYRAGSYSFLDLLQAQATAVSADQAVAASEQAVSDDQVAVFQALGGGWEGAPKILPPPIGGKTPQIR